MTDQAPRSSAYIRRRLHFTCDIPEQLLSRLTIVTAITRKELAETTIQRPIGRGPDEQEYWDQQIQESLRGLEGFAGSIIITMGRTFTVEWDGVRAPV